MDDIMQNACTVFQDVDSPLAVHARLRWMNGGGRDKAAAKRLVDQIRRRQSDDGSWDGSVAATIRSTFALWLLMDGPDAATGKAVNWLVESGHPPMQHACGDGASYDGLFFRMGRGDRAALRDMDDVPFTSGCGGFVKSGAALFLATVLKQGDPACVNRAYESLARIVQARNGRWCSGSCGNNILLAFSVHPAHRKSPAMRRAVAWLRDHQNSRGSWDKGVPFYPTVWALSRLDCPVARAQLRPAMDRLDSSRNADGSWGRSQRVLHTFLALDALEHHVSARTPGPKRAPR